LNASGRRVQRDGRSHVRTTWQLINLPAAPGHTSMEWAGAGAGECCPVRPKFSQRISAKAAKQMGSYAARSTCLHECLSIAEESSTAFEQAWQGASKMAFKAGSLCWWGGGPSKRRERR